MTRLALTNQSLPDSFQSMFRDLARPWRFDDSFFDVMLRPGMQMFEPSFGESLETMFRRMANTWRLRDSMLEGMDVHVDVVEKDGTYQVHADLPGVKKEDINVRIDGNVVRIDAQTHDAREIKGNGDNVLCNERYYGAVSRTFSLGQAVDETKATGKYADGVLTLELPKKASAPEPEAKRIEIH